MEQPEVDPSPSAEALRTAALECHFELDRQAGIDAYPKGSTPPPAHAPGLAGISARIAACRACGLHGTRSQVVPGEGNPGARILFVGEAPGADEDRQGRPFVGRAGKLLTRIIEDGIGLPREEVFIANILKCRPPENRDPASGEKAACTPFLEEQIAAIDPELIVALGRHAACHLLDTQASMASMRGVIHERRDGRAILATYHPAYLLRNPPAKKDCWEDLKLGMQHIGLTLPESGGDQ